MAKLTIIIDDWGHRELQKYLLSLKGIQTISIKNEELLEIYLKYDSKIISPKIIKKEILLFLNLQNIPSIISFNKHFNETSEYKILPDDICCEYCFKGFIEELFDTEGIEKVDSNFYDLYYQKPKNKEKNNYIITIKYNKNIITEKTMQEIVSKLNN